MREPIDPVLIERATEQLRQERETFNQRKVQESRWFNLRLIMEHASVILIVVIMVVSSNILFNAADFSNTVVGFAGAALFVDVLGLLIGVWKIVLNPGSVTKLEPVTVADQDAIGSQDN